LEIWFGTLEFTLQIGQFWNVKPVATQNPIQIYVIGTWVGRVRDPIQKKDWTCDLERPAEMLYDVQTPY
jgi:hypothetical protein